MKGQLLCWGIIGAGRISNDFSIGLLSLSKDEHKLEAVASRNLEQSIEFAKTFEIPKAYGSYEEILNDSAIDVIYIGTINSTHFDLVKLALDHNKHVLSEKNLCVNYKEAKELTDYAKSKNLFLMEGIWSRFFPAQEKILEEIKKGSIGDVVQIQSSFGFPAEDENHHIYHRENGGGSTLSIGFYCVQLANLVFGRLKPENVYSTGNLTERGTDRDATNLIIYPGGKSLSFVTNLKVNLPNEALIIGTKGMIKVHFPFWCPTKISISGNNLNEDFEFELPKSDRKAFYLNPTGLALQCNEVRKCILNGQNESEIASHEDSLYICQILDKIRENIGVIYPQD